MKRVNLSLMISIGILFISVLVLIMALFNKNDPPGMDSVNIYFYSKINNSLKTEKRLITIKDKFKTIEQLLKEFLVGSRDQTIGKIYHEDLVVTEIIELEDNIFEISFSQEYFNMTPIEEVFFRSSLVLTMTELNFINGIRISVGSQELIGSNGFPMGILNSSNTRLDPKLSSELIKTKEIKLYFSDESGNFLRSEDRIINLNPNEMEYKIVQELIEGPKTKNNLPTLSVDIKIRNVKTKAGICFVDLSEDFINKNPSATTQDKIAVYSIVNSLTELTNVKKVQFLINSAIAPQKGDIDLSMPFEHDEFIITSTEETF